MPLSMGVGSTPNVFVCAGYRAIPLCGVWLDGFSCMVVVPGNFGFWGDRQRIFTAADNGFFLSIVAFVSFLRCILIPLSTAWHHRGR